MNTFLALSYNFLGHLPATVVLDVGEKFPTNQARFGRGVFYIFRRQGGFGLCQEFYMIKTFLLQNSGNPSGTYKGTYVSTATQNFFKSFSFVADPSNWAFRVTPYEVLFT
jgi:hypothetical protein